LSRKSSEVRFDGRDGVWRSDNLVDVEGPEVAHPTVAPSTEGDEFGVIGIVTEGSILSWGRNNATFGLDLAPNKGFHVEVTGSLKSLSE
jgi:hypothetical protein